MNISIIINYRNDININNNNVRCNMKCVIWKIWIMKYWNSIIIIINMK